MNRKQVIETLKMENELICFNPLTSEEIPLECVNELNRNCYEAHQEAIRLIKNSIPIELIEKEMKRLDEDIKWAWYYGNVALDKMEYLKMWLTIKLEDWRKENEID